MLKSTFFSLLLSFRQVSFNDVDRGGNTPLHIAAMNGRAANIELLLRKAKEKSQKIKPIKATVVDEDDENENEGEDEAMEEDGEGNEQMIDVKYGLASINRMNKSRFYPLHLAVMNGHLVRTQTEKENRYQN